MDDRTLAERIENWQHSIQTQTDKELIESVNRELSNTGWVQLKAYYLKELRDELHRRGLGDGDAARALDRRVTATSDAPDG